MEYTRKYDGML